MPEGRRIIFISVLITVLTLTCFALWLQGPDKDLATVNPSARFGTSSLIVAGQADKKIRLHGSNDLHSDNGGILRHGLTKGTRSLSRDGQTPGHPVKSPVLKDSNAERSKHGNGEEATRSEIDSRDFHDTSAAQRRVRAEKEALRATAGTTNLYSSLDRHTEDNVSAQWTSHSGRFTAHNRIRRGRTCRVHLVADPSFHKFYGRSDVLQTTRAMVSALLEASSVFRESDFNGDGQADNVTLEIHDVTLMSESSASQYRIHDAADESEYLHRVSYHQFNDVCLGIVFTYRDFPKGVVGMSWLASSSVYGYPGGICSNPGYFDDFLTPLSMNTAAVSGKVYGKRMSQLELAITLAHELGHSFGSLHDNYTDAHCAQIDVRGDFLMSDVASDTAEPNSRVFSKCSLDQIAAVLRNKGSCLLPETLGRCGNFIVDSDEECDCGTEKTCPFVDPCCVPAGHPRQCKLVPQASCSPSASPCCHSSCTPVAPSWRMVCADKTACSAASYCDGLSLSCPQPKVFDRDVVCGGGRLVCSDGVCSTSMCEVNGLVPCQCDCHSEDACKLCCANHTDAPCVPASTFRILSESGSDIYVAADRRCGATQRRCNGSNIILDRVSTDYMPRVNRGAFSWLSHMWFYILVFALLAGLALAVIQNTPAYELPTDLHYLAYRTGKISSIHAQAQWELRKLEGSMKELDETLNSAIRDCVDDVTRPMSAPEAMGRLGALFPLVSKREITLYTSLASSEDVVVRLLIAKGYKMLYFSSIPDKLSSLRKTTSLCKGCAVVLLEQ